MATTPTLFINGVRQGWAQIEFNFLGRQVTGITEFGVNVKQDKSNEMGQGNEPIHRAHGNKSYETPGMKLYKYEFDAMCDQLEEGQDMTDAAPFTVTCIYTAKGDDKLRKLIVPMTEVTEIKHNPKSGDKNLEVELGLIIGKPIWNKK